MYLQKYDIVLKYVTICMYFIVQVLQVNSK